jgi:hypothetical protein
MITAVLGYRPLEFSNRDASCGGVVPIVQVLGAERSPARFARLTGHWRRTPDGGLALHWHANPAWELSEPCEPPEEHASGA